MHKKVATIILAVIPLLLMYHLRDSIAIDQKKETKEEKVSPQFNYSTPEGVVKAIFYAAKTGQYRHLKDICDPVEIQPPANCVCQLGGGYKPPVKITSDCSNLDEKRFRSLFGQAKIYSVDTKWSIADVYYDYGSEIQPTISLTKRNNRWYLFTITLPEDTDI